VRYRTSSATYTPSWPLHDRIRWRNSLADFRVGYAVRGGPTLMSNMSIASRLIANNARLGCRTYRLLCLLRS